MACVEGGELERAFLEALQSVAAWRIVDGRLELRDAAGRVVARFASVAE
jgi:heat shock protein HslJ